MVEQDLRAMDIRHTLPNLKNLLLTLTDGEVVPVGLVFRDIRLAILRLTFKFVMCMLVHLRSVHHHRRPRLSLAWNLPDLNRLRKLSRVGHQKLAL